MIEINSIKKLKNDRYVIEVNVKDALVPHIITENTIIKHNLLSKKSLSNDEYKRIIKDNEYELLYLKALNFISYQMRSISEVRKHLMKTTRSENLITKIINELKNNKYLDDSNYVAEYVNEKLEYDLVGPAYIKQKLIQKGIHFDLIEDRLSNYTDDEQFEKIQQIITKELQSKQTKPYQKVYLSIKQKLVTRGFSLNLIESALLSSKDDIKEMIDEDMLMIKEISKVKMKFNLNDYNEKNKLIKKLMAKGYHYDLIKKHLK